MKPFDLKQSGFLQIQGRWIGVAMIALALLTGCGGQTIPSEALGNAFVLGNGPEAEEFVYEKIKVTVTQVWTDMRPLSQTDQAQVLVRLETAEDVLQTGEAGPFMLAGSGVVKVEEEGFVFESSAGFKGHSAGEGELIVWRPVEGVDKATPWPWIPFELTVPVEMPNGIVKVYVAGILDPGQRATAVLTSNENVIGVTGFTCQGVYSPDRGRALVTFLAETADGRALTGGGVMEGETSKAADGQSLPFECRLTGNGTVNAVFEPNDAPFKVRQITLDTLELRGPDGQNIMFETLMGPVVLGGIVYEIE